MSLRNLERLGDFELFKGKQQNLPTVSFVCLCALAWPACVPFSAVSLFFFRPVERVQEGSRGGGEG